MKAPLLISESAIKIHYGPFRFLYLVFSLLPPPLSLLSFFISSLFNAYFFDTYLEAKGNEATLKAKLFLDMIFFKLFAFVFRSIKIKLAEIFVIKRLTLFIYFFFETFYFQDPFFHPFIDIRFKRIFALPFNPRTRHYRAGNSSITKTGFLGGVNAISARLPEAKTENKRSRQNGRYKQK